MPQTITLQLSDETLRRYQRGALAARKVLEQFLVERLADDAPPLADTLPPPLREELRELETMDDQTLSQIAQSQLAPEQQRLYNRLLRKNSRGTLTPSEKRKLHALGEEARRLTLKKAHAYLLLKWRGHNVSLPEA